MNTSRSSTYAGLPMGLRSSWAFLQAVSFGSIKAHRASDRSLALPPNHTEGIRSKLKCLVSRQILTGIEPGLFAQSRPRPCTDPPEQQALPNADPVTDTEPHNAF